MKLGNAYQTGLWLAGLMEYSFFNLDLTWSEDAWTGSGDVLKAVFESTYWTGAYTTMTLNEWIDPFFSWDLTDVVQTTAPGYLMYYNVQLFQT